MKSAVRIKDVSVVLSGEFTALKDVSVDIPEGKIVGFIGPSGAGKTTLMRAIVGRQRIRKGTITIFDLPAGSPKLRPQLSYMTQETSVYGDLTVRENVQYFATIYGVPKEQLKAEVDAILQTVQLTDHASSVVQKLSSGQKQRVSLAIALIGSPKLLVLDEPTVGLDPVLREELWKLFRTLAAQGITLLISSHVMDEAEHCDDLLLIRDGQLLAHGSPDELRQQTKTDSVERAFLALVGAKGNGI